MQDEIKTLSIQCKTRSRASDVISRDSSPADFLFSFTDWQDFWREFGTATPPQRSILLYRARDDDIDGKVNGARYFVLGSRYVLPDPTRCLFSSLSLSLSFLFASLHRRLLHPERSGNRTNSGFDDPNGEVRRDVCAHTPHDRMRSSVPRARLVAKRGPTDTVVIHLTTGFRDSLTFLRIGPFRWCETRDAGRPPARGRISACFVLRQTGRYPVDYRWSFGHSFVRPDGQEIRCCECVQKLWRNELIL